MLAKLFAIARYIVGGVGLFIGLSLLNTNLTKAVAVTSLTAVGLVGLISFVSHVMLHAQDARLIGLKAKGDDFQFEVGFANFAFGTTAVISYFAHWGIQANTVLILAYAVYLLQAGILHSTKSLAGKKKDIVHFVRGGLISFAYSGLMLFVAIKAITSGLF